jgi:eukaryotic-like serine/threonine-protein kinase
MSHRVRAELAREALAARKLACSPKSATSYPPGPTMHAVSSPPTSEPSLPRSFGRYTLFELIGRGGMAQIYLARAETELGATRLAVVKEILPAFAHDRRFADMLTHEAKLAAKLSHAHIVQVFDLGSAEGHLFIAMEYVEGFDLNALLRQCTEKQVGLPAQHALGIVADVLEGLDYAHRRRGEDGRPLGLVHRDVSPSNVLISYEGEVKLCDFGIAHANDVVKEGATEALKGKAGYMSPEHARGESLDARADVFAAGIILWELLAGRRLYRARADMPLLDQARAGEIPALPDKGLPNPAALEAIVRRALATDREARYPSAAAFVRDLEGYLADNHMLASRLKLGEWIATTFGTGIIEQRRASERKLPKSNPPPRSSERVRASSAPASSAVIPKAASVPEAPAESEPSVAALPMSNGAMLAFKKELEQPPVPTFSIEPESLAAIDVSPSSHAAVDPNATGRASSPAAGELVARRTALSPAVLVLTLLAILAALVALGRVLVH